MAKNLTKSDLEKSLTAIARVVGKNEFIVIGTGSSIPFLDPEKGFSYSVDIDFVTIREPFEQDFSSREKVREAIGPLTAFENENDFYVQNVDSWLIEHLTPGWKERAKEITVEGPVRCFCIHLLDLAFNKIMAGRDKDVIYVNRMLQEGVIGADELRAVIDTSSSEEVRKKASSRLEMILANSHQIEKILREGKSLSEIRRDYMMGEITLEDAVRIGVKKVAVTKSENIIQKFMRNPNVRESNVMKQLESFSKE